MNNKSDITIKCIDCGFTFTFTKGEQKFFMQKEFDFPKRCKKCRKEHKTLRNKQKQEIGDNLWHKQENIKIQLLLNELCYNQIALSEICISEPSSTLYIIGNGFDIMHGVNSRYCDFRDSMGKNNHLRRLLETYIKSDNLWSDFEESLAHIDGSSLLSNVDNFMDIFGAYHPDSQAADFFAAYETAVQPAQEITSLLPKKFRKWVDALKTTKDPLLTNIMHPESLYLNFNYTEFVETLYGIPPENITYIHGCRKNKHHELILGHAPQSRNEDDWSPSMPLPNYKSKRKSELLESAIESATQNLLWYDEETTKKTPEIIINNNEFFSKTSDIQTIIVLGHSLSKVDYPYFQEIMNTNYNKANWFFSWYSSKDLENIQNFVSSMNIDDSKVSISTSR